MHVLRSSDIVEEEFPGKMLYTSTDVNDQVCGYQTLVNCPDKNKVFLLKMYQSFIKMIELTQIEKKKELSFDIEKGEWDYLDARIMNHDNCAMLAIIYGKDYEYEPEEDQDYLTQYYLKEDEQNTSISRITINKYEHVMVIKLEGML